MTTFSDNILGELRGLLAQRPSFERDAAICELMAFNSRVALEQSGAWDYMCAASRRGTLGAVWDDGAWCDVRAGRLWGRAKKGAMSLRGTTPLKAHVLDDFIDQTRKVPCLSLDLGFLSDMLGEVFTEMLARADLSRLMWLDLSNDTPGPGLTQLLSMHELPALKSLELQGLEVDDLRDVPALARLVHLGVAHSKVDDDWMRRHVTPQVMPALRSLDLNDTEVVTSVWEQLGEQHGYEHMYALKMCATWMTSREVGLCRWLPCLEWIDTIAFELHGDIDGVVYEEGLALLEDGLTGVRDLELRMVDVSQDIQAETLTRLARLPYYDRLCALGLGRIWLNQDNMDALRISHEVSGASALCHFALLYVYGDKISIHDYWEPYFEPQFDMAGLTNWARLSNVQSFELALTPGHEREHRYDHEEWLLESILSMTSLERVKLRGLTRTEINIWFVLWGRSKTLAELEALEMLGCDLQLSGIERIETLSISGPLRWVFDGCASLEERALLLNSFSDAIAYGSKLLPWFNKLDLERAAAYVHEFEQDDDIW